MASKDVQYHLSKETCGPYQITKVGKFWLLKIRGKPKRISFLENANEVFITENILVADDEIFEINEDKDGQISFERVEELSYKSKDSKSHLKMKVQDRQDKNFEECREIGTARVDEYALPLYDETNENLSINKLTIHDNCKIKKEKHLADSEFIRKKSDRSGKDAIEKNEVQHKTDAKRTSFALQDCSDRDDDFDRGHEEYVSFENGSTEVDSTKEIEAKTSDLTKLQGPVVNSGQTVIKMEEKIHICHDMVWEVISIRHTSELEQLKKNFDEFRYEYDRTIIVTAAGTSDVLESRLKELRKFIERFDNKEWAVDNAHGWSAYVSKNVFALCNEIESTVGYECCMYEPRTQNVIMYCDTYEELKSVEHLFGVKTNRIKRPGRRVIIK